MFETARRALLAGATGVAALALAACGGGGGQDAAPPQEPQPATTAEAQEGEPAPGDEQRFTARNFGPRLTFTLPPGWTADEVEPGLVQAFAGDNQDRGITFDASFANQPVERVVERLRGLPGIDAEQPRSASVGGAKGQVFDATVTGDVEIPGSGYFPPPEYAVRAYVLRAGDRTVAIFVDVPEDEAETFFPQAQRVLETVELGRE